MKVEIKKSGNSATLRIPSDILKSLDLSIGDEMYLEITSNGMFLRKIDPPRKGWFDNLDSKLIKSESAVMEQEFGPLQSANIDDWQNGQSW